MRIALVTQLYAPEFEGGTERVVRTQARELARRGHELRVITGTAKARGGEPELGCVDDIAVTRVARRPEEMAWNALELPRVADAVRAAARGADVVHVHHWSTLGLGLVRALASQAPVVATLHDDFATCPRAARLSPIAGLECPPPGEVETCVRCLAPELERAAGSAAPGAGELARALHARRAAFDDELAALRGLVLPSRSLATAFARHARGSLGPLHVVPHGLGRALERAAERSPWDGERPLAVLHFGHLSRAKGILDLVRSLATLPRGSATLDLAGGLLEPGLERALGAAARAGESPLEVTLHGPYDSARLARLAARADLAVFPSRLPESYGLVVDEACALGLPTWVADRGALGERLEAHGSPGRVLPAGDPEAWRAAFAELREDPAALALERARCVAPVDSAERAAARLEALYEDLRARGAAA